MDQSGVTHVADEEQRGDGTRKMTRKHRWSISLLQVVVITLTLLIVMPSVVLQMYSLYPGSGKVHALDCAKSTSATDTLSPCALFSSPNPDMDPLLELMLLRWQRPGYPPLNFSDPGYRSTIKWPTDAPVVVPAVFRDFDVALPLWLFRWPTFVYQRQNPAKPLFSPNFGHEGGVYLQFIVDFYDNLPERVAFVQGTPDLHNDKWENMIRCMKPQINFAPLAPWIRMNKTHSQVAEGHDEQLLNCLLNTARAFHKELPRDPLIIGYNNQMYMVSRDVIRKHTHMEYIRAYNIITARDDVCHVAGVEWDGSGNVLPMANASRSFGV